MKIFVKTILLLFFALRLCGQDSTENKILGHMYSMDTSFWAIKGMADGYIYANPTKSFMAKKYGRWQEFWLGRVDSFGGFMTSQIQMAAVAANPSACNTGGDWKQIGPAVYEQAMGIITNVYSPPGNTNVIYAGSNTAGLWKTTDGGGTWVCKTDVLNTSGIAITSITSDPMDNNTIYISTGISHPFSVAYGAGVFVSYDAGDTWQVIPDLSFPIDFFWNNTTRQVFTVPPSPPSYTATRVYAMTARELYYSYDGGLSFTKIADAGTIPLSEHEQFIDIELLPSDITGQTLVITTSNRSSQYQHDSKVYLLTNTIKPGSGTATWTNITPPQYSSLSFPYTGMEMFKVEVSQAAPNNIYVVGSYYPLVGQPNKCPLLVSSNNGQTWTEINPDISTNASDGSCGGSPNTTSPGVRINAYRHVFEINQADPNVIYIGNLNVYKSTDSGLSFTKVSAYYPPTSVNSTHADIRSIQIISSSIGGGTDVLLMGNDGGVAFSTSGGNGTNCTGWLNINGNGASQYVYDGGELVSTQFYDIANSSISENIKVAGGTQDNCNFRYDGISWTRPSDCDGGQHVYDWSNSNRLFYNQGGTFYSDPGGSIGVTGNGFEDFDLEQDPLNPNMVYIAKDRLFNKYDVTGNPPFVHGYTFPCIGTSCNDVICFAVAPSNPNIIYLSTTDADGDKGRLHRSTDNGVSFVDISDASVQNGAYDTTIVNTLRNSLNYIRVIDIAVDPEDPNRVWCAMSGFGGDVWYLDFAHDTVIFSTGLPRVPISSVKYQKGSNDVLYAGTDIGVYRHTPSTGWQCYSNNLPPVLVTDVEIDYCRQILHIGTYGRGIWESPLAATTPRNFATNYTIPSTAIYNSANDITVKSGATLTVAGTLNMGKDTKIIIEPGGKIALTGSITNLCGEVWQGIEIWGSGNGTTQLPTLQGVIEINGGTIAYAKEAVRLWRPGYINTTGGIVKAANATFHNNWRSAEFIRYQNGTTPNISYFVSCTFKVDDDYREFSARVPFLGHLSMWAVDGIKIVGCNFENQVSNHPLFTRAEDYGYGILSADAQFDVLQSCSVVGCPTWTPNTFYRMFEGMNINRISSAFSPIIDRAVFKDCHYGVFNNEVNNLSLTRSTFEIGGFPKARPGASNIHEGVVINTAIGFNITENNFRNSVSNPTNAVRLGTRAVGTGGTFNRIYRNTLSTSVGHLANATNAQRIAPFIGLVYECNTHSNAISDITAFNGVNADPLVIGLNQGNSGEPSGNTFSNTLIFNVNNFVSPQQTTVQYWYSTGVGAVNENPTLIRNISKFNTLSRNGCASILPPVSGDVSEELSSGEVSALIAVYNQSTSSLQTARNGFNSKVDMGNSPYWLNRVQSAGHGGPANAIAKDLEDNVSPWVSEPVLRALFANANFNNSKIHKVLEANPDVLRDAAFMDFVITSNRFNASQLNKLEQAKLLSTERTEKGSLVAAYSGERSKAVYAIIRNELNRQNGVDWFGIDAWLQKIPSPETDYARVEIYRQLTDWQKSTFILDSMPAKYNFNQEEYEAHQDYRQLQLILCAIDGPSPVGQPGPNQVSLMNLDSPTLQSLEILANKGYARAHIQAQSILNFAYEGEYRRPALFPPDVIQARQLMEEEEAEADLGKELWVRPNPAKDRAEVVVNLSQDDKNAIIKVVDINGKVLYQQNISKDQSIYGFDISTWAAGVYYVFVETENRKIKPVALSVIK